MTKLHSDFSFGEEWYKLRDVAAKYFMVQTTVKAQTIVQ